MVRPAPRKAVDITTHQFAVALSFPAEHRQYVQLVANELRRLLRPDACFYDEYYKAQLARPRLDLALQRIYSEDGSGLVVVFHCTDYDKKKWCGIELQQILERRSENIMNARVGDGEVPGIGGLDGYIDTQKHTPEQFALLISEMPQVSSSRTTQSDSPHSLETHDRLNVAGDWQVVELLKDNRALVERGGRVGETALGDDIHASWECTRCGKAGPWNGVLCLSCGNRQDPWD